ncbi:hypothetical protein H0A36_30015 [Endozoicomonas sp. SM1973]|uniref:Uncharacterized protein n=2 Tax=Spartinivicinus marinus TaxID=2994442 RepID=A0A853IJH3_9GAMM|nr:hypothetical protein [Spartinivicinus marinus]MCX4025035.1 hypothetical protein [Spartinivicinus marinus]MCX4025162.1 hypothetical protein [Spartinivicinus marinus]MCX4027838.1 hypothetical protein [Spartinivicinus marinus]MCX4027943.1 hypothetical protein [Spartinivicinus marinus]NYZ70251.1 hypothetical protein [Spartinivicinus marinus]
MMTIEQRLADAVQASNQLTEVVQNKINDINQQLKAAEDRFNAFMLEAHKESPFYRQSKNQFGNLVDKMLDGFDKSEAFSIEVSLYREIKTGIDWEQRDSEEKEILTCMGLKGHKYLQPTIRVLRLKWSGYDRDTHNAYSIYPTVPANRSVPLTVGCYAKLISGDIRYTWLNGVNHEWGVCGANYESQPGSYFHAHPYVYSPAGEVLFFWPAIVTGYVPIDRDKPLWGYYPSMHGENPFDTDPLPDLDRESRRSIERS